MQDLELITGSLTNTFPRIVPESLGHAHEVHAFRETHPESKNTWTWTADFSMYRVEDGDAILYFAPREHNLIFKNFDDAISQLRKGNYTPTEGGIDEVVKAVAQGKGLRINIKDLDLQKHNKNDDYGYFKTDSMNNTQKAFVKAIYGKDKTPGKAVYVLDSKYIETQLHGKEDSAIARASGLGWADFGSRFNAVGWVVVGADVGLLGVLKVAPKAPEKIDIPALGYTQEGILNYLNNHSIQDEKFAAELLKVANTFYQAKAK